MMEQEEIIAFFDRCAPDWDAGMVRNEAVIEEILQNAHLQAGASVLDVACGTGVLFPDYLRAGATDVTAIDISPEMARIARQKFPQVRVLCGDVEQTAFDRRFSLIMVYNAFPHFPEPDRLLKTLSGLLCEGGCLSIAHGMSRAQINTHHEGSARGVSRGLMAAEELAALMARFLTVETAISDDRMYQVVGRK